MQGSGLERPARPTVADGPVAAGAMLRQAREAAGVHLGSLAQSLKVPAGRLEALETGRIDLLPDPTFARALAASVCRSLRIDPEPVLQLLPRTATSATAADAVAARTAFRSDARPAGAARSGGVSRWIGIAALVLLAVTGVLIFAPELGWHLPGLSGLPGRASPGSAVATRDGDSGAMMSEPALTGNALTRVTPEVARPVASDAVTAAPALATPSSATAPAATVAPVAKASAVPAQAASVASAPAATPAAPKPTEDTMVFQTQVPAWIQVLDASGAALVKRTVAAGETVRVSSDALPLKVTVGHADKTKVKVRGEAFDLDPVSRGGVARFTVK